MTRAKATFYVLKMGRAYLQRHGNGWDDSLAGAELYPEREGAVFMRDALRPDPDGVPQPPIVVQPVRVIELPSERRNRKRTR